MKYKLKKSLGAQERAKNCIPGMTQLLSKRPDMFSLGVWPGYFSKASGVHVWDLDGNEYVDMSISGIGANVLGYADPDVDNAVKNAIDNGTSCSLNCLEEVELAEMLCELHSWVDMVRFARTGGEAMSVAVRIARARTGLDKIAFCGYHGWHDWYLAANLGSDGNALGEHHLPGLSPIGVPKGLAGTMYPFHYNRLDELKEIVSKHGKELAAIVMEPVRSNQPDPGFLEGVKEVAKEIGAVLVFDEVSSGFRVSTGGAHLVLGVNPDIAVLSKAMGNGYPIAAIIGTADVMQAAQNTFISSTYWTERIGFTAALAVIEKFQKRNVADHLNRIGELVQDGWRQAAEKNGLDLTIGGIPPLSHFVFGAKDPLSLKALFVQLMLERGFLATNLFYAMYAHKEEHVTQYLMAVADVFTEITRSITQGDVEKKLNGLPANAGFTRLT